MKRLILVMGFIFMLLAGCGNTGDKVTITTDPNAYTPAMSSVQGITMTPAFETKLTITPNSGFYKVKE